MKKLTVYLSLALTVTGLASCEKELDQVSQPAAQAEAAAKQTPQEMLAAGQWHMTNLTTTSQAAGSSEATTVSLFGQLKTTQRDNLTQYTTDGRYVQDEGATKMNTAQEQQKSGSYTLSEDGQTLVVKLADYERKYTVADLSANSLVLKLSEGEGTAAVTYTSTFAH